MPTSFKDAMQKLKEDREKLKNNEESLDSIVERVDISYGKKENKQLQLFNLPEWWNEHWQDMPEYAQTDLNPEKSVFVHFKTLEDMRAFSEKINQKITSETKFIWYPEVKPKKLLNIRMVDSTQSEKEETV